ncbi:MAG TPA: DUF6787 family protein [Cyclobacteriaceae bacterium]|nr:DUF6787 family protein [Cyclobacteriaceae bacterium]
MSWLDKLKDRWKVGSILQVIVILIVFACTGFTVLLLKRPLFNYLFEGGEVPIWASVVYYILILPVYNVFLLFYGFVFGQFQFFWNFEKRFFARFSRKKN